MIYIEDTEHFSKSITDTFDGYSFGVVSTYYEMFGSDEGIWNSILYIQSEESRFLS